jgi:hypothetical protein
MNNRNFINSTISFIKKSKANNEKAITALWHLAKKEKDIDSLSEIAGLKNLPIKVEEEVKQRNEIPIAVAYLTRDGIDQSERKTRIESENRAGVLAGVLESANVSDFEREIIGDKLINKPTKALSEIAIKDFKIKPIAIAVAILQLENRYTQLSEEVRRATRQQIDRCAKDLNASKKLANELTNSSLAERFLSLHPEITESEFSNLFNRAIIPLLKDGINTRMTNNEVYVNTKHMVNICKKILGENDDYFPNVILKGLKSIIIDSETLSKIWTECVGATKASEESAIDNNFSNLLISAEITEDQEKLTELMGMVESGNNALIKPLLKNKALKYNYVEILINKLERRDVSYITTWRPFDQDAILYAYMVNFDTMVYSDKYESFLDKYNAKSILLDYMITQWYKGEYNYYSPVTSNISKLISDSESNELIGRLPYGITQLSNNYFDSANEYLLEKMNSILESDLKKWEIINIISKDFNGSIDELILAASTL